MSDDPRERSDFSRFLVHLTRKTKGTSPEDNLISILKDKRIEARNFHCLYGPKLKKCSCHPSYKKDSKPFVLLRSPSTRFIK